MTRARSTILRLGGQLARLPARFVWGFCSVLISCIPVAGALSTTRVYCLRDLAFYFWPAHLWIRNSLMNGEFPLWDPYVGFGQAALSDPVRHILHPVIALLRFVPSEALGFNLAVALPIPVAAAGMYCFLNRRVGVSAAALGSIVFAGSGPMLSTANMLNFSWAAAALPWVLLAVDHLVKSLTPRRFAATSIAFAMLFLAGEGPTVVGGGILSVAYALTLAPSGCRLRSTARVFASGLCGIALAGALSVPFLYATLGSLRAGGMDPRVPAFWSLHPLTMLQTVCYSILGNPTGGSTDSWVPYLNGYPEPFVYSVYVGIGALTLAALGFGSKWRTPEGWFWMLAAAVSLLVAFGKYAPFYGIVRTVLPVADALRFPVKFVFLTAFSVAVLSSFGWELLSKDPRENGTSSPVDLIRATSWTTAGLGVTGAAGLALMGVGGVTPAVVRLAGAVGASDPDAAADFLVSSILLALPRLIVLLMGLAGALALIKSSPDFRRYGLAIVFVTASLDPVLTGTALFPMADVGFVSEPSWAAQVRESGARLYVGGRLQFVIDRTPDPDDLNLERGLPLTGDSSFESRAAFSTVAASFPSAWRVRDSFSFDNAMLWPREYWNARDRFRSASYPERRRFLEKAGVAFFLVTWNDVAGASRVERYSEYAPLSLWRVDAPQPRATLATEWVVEPDIQSAIARAFEDRREVLVDRITQPVGVPGLALEPSATIVDESSGRVSIRATAPEAGGMLVLRDSWANGWRVSVDGEQAIIARADGLFRAVHLSAGQHQIEFEYEPPGFRLGIGLTTMTAMGLALFVALGRRAER